MFRNRGAGFDDLSALKSLAEAIHQCPFDKAALGFSLRLHFRQLCALIFSLDQPTTNYHAWKYFSNFL